MRRARSAAVVTAVLLTSTACLPTDSPPPTRSETAMPQSTPDKAGDGTERHDLEPLTSRIGALTGVPSATWYSGTLGDPSAPGPSTYWIDAVVQLPAGVAEDLAASLDLSPAQDAPDVVPALAGDLPAGELLSGPELDAAFSADGWYSTAYLSVASEELVLVVVGEG